MQDLRAIGRDVGVRSQSKDLLVTMILNRYLA